MHILLVFQNYIKLYISKLYSKLSQTKIINIILLVLLDIYKNIENFEMLIYIYIIHLIIPLYHCYPI